MTLIFEFTLLLFQTYSVLHWNFLYQTLLIFTAKQNEKEEHFRSMRFLGGSVRDFSWPRVWGGRRWGQRMGTPRYLVGKPWSCKTFFLGKIRVLDPESCWILISHREKKFRVGRIRNLHPFFFLRVGSSYIAYWIRNRVFPWRLGKISDNIIQMMFKVGPYMSWWHFRWKVTSNGF